MAGRMWDSNYNWSGIGIPPSGADQFGNFMPNFGGGPGLGPGPGSGNGSGFQFGWNAPTFQLGFQGLNTIGNLWGAWQSNKLARDQLNFTKDFANRNLANQTAAYNTALEDRGRARAAVEGQTSAEAQAYIDRNRLPTRG